MASVMDKIKAKTEELKNKNNIDIYKSIIDYDKCGIIEIDIREKLIVCEKKAVHHASEIQKNTFELSKIFYEAQELLANHGGGTFRSWFESLGFKKDFVYMCLKRNNLFLETKEEKIFSLSDRAIKTISKIKNKINPEKILEIVNAENPLEVAKLKEKELSVRPTTEIIEDAEIINSKEEENIKVKSNLEEIEKLKKEISLKEQELKELKKQLREKESLEENKNNLKIDFKPILSTTELLFLRNNNVEVDLDEYLLVDEIRVSKWFDDALTNGLDNKNELQNYILVEKNIGVRIEYYKKIAELDY